MTALQKSPAHYRSFQFFIAFSTKEWKSDSAFPISILAAGFCQSDGALEKCLFVVDIGVRVTFDFELLLVGRLAD
jgi:hypothetical protein